MAEKLFIVIVNQGGLVNYATIGLTIVSQNLASTLDCANLLMRGMSVSALKVGMAVTVSTASMPA